MAAPSDHPALCQGGNRARSVAARTPSGGGRFGSDCSFKEWRAGAAGRTDLRAEGEPGVLGPRGERARIGAVRGSGMRGRGAPLGAQLTVGGRRLKEGRSGRGAGGGRERLGRGEEGGLRCYCGSARGNNRSSIRWAQQRNARSHPFLLVFFFVVCFFSFPILFPLLRYYFSVLSNVDGKWNVV